ncbi:EF-hand domain-containing protein [Marinobacter zhejiangensis]|uniref:EF hand n=1 Tax=Marinobacter zhejiangensis TaxID=488535 RepID=A0A1I4LH67_9GAMM|nr:EF-hand domain-containing protein [Marinobacter zhejiangensis]SFL89947.1 hypothetical protein SAMN04487963_0459 [Marinobacter zhejiangensis]
MKKDSKPRLLLALTLALGVVISGCAGYGTGGQDMGDDALTEGARAQFDCANRNGNEFIESAELVFLVQCGVREGQRCGDIPDEMSEQPSSREQFRQGRRLLDIMDLNKDQKISKLEFRAFCNSQGG